MPLTIFNTKPSSHLSGVSTLLLSISHRLGFFLADLHLSALSLYVLKFLGRSNYWNHHSFFSSPKYKFISVKKHQLTAEAQTCKENRCFAPDILSVSQFDNFGSNCTGKATLNSCQHGLNNLWNVKLMPLTLYILNWCTLEVQRTPHSPCSTRMHSGLFFDQKDMSSYVCMKPHQGDVWQILSLQASLDMTFWSLPVYTAVTGHIHVTPLSSPHLQFWFYQESRLICIMMDSKNKEAGFINKCFHTDLFPQYSFLTQHPLQKESKCTDASNGPSYVQLGG